MKALMLAAGRGMRLSGGDETRSPKCLLRFGGKTLLQRHIENLKSCGADGLTLVVGYHDEQIRAEVSALDAEGFVTFIENPRFREGSVISMAAAAETMTSGDPILFMDADVLYDPAILTVMLEDPSTTCFPYDRDFEEGDEPVKLCVKDGIPVEFRKVPDPVAFDLVGEWIGFIYLDPDFASALSDKAVQMSVDPTDDPYEDAVRDLLLNGWADRVTVADVTGHPWIEIDFPEDVVRAETEILPQISRPN